MEESFERNIKYHIRIAKTRLSLSLNDLVLSFQSYQGQTYRRAYFRQHIQIIWCVFKNCVLELISYFLNHRIRCYVNT